MIDPFKVSSSCIIKDLEELFAILVLHEFGSWFNYHSTSSVMWLCHSILIDIHNVFCHIAFGLFWNNSPSGTPRQPSSSGILPSISS
jgi:hypothetical protein